MNVLRKIIPLILLTVLLLSCSNNETADVGTPGQVINFNTINDKI